MAEASWQSSSKKLLERLLALAWPKYLHSLSHTSLLFPPDDTVYGYDVKDSDGIDVIALGNLSLRGEQGVLAVSARNLLLLRSNPFYSSIEQRITDSVIQSAPGPV